MGTHHSSYNSNYEINGNALDSFVKKPKTHLVGKVIGDESLRIKGVFDMLNCAWNGFGRFTISLLMENLYEVESADE